MRPLLFYLIVCICLSACNNETGSSNTKNEMDSSGSLNKSAHVAIMTDSACYIGLDNLLVDSARADTMRNFFDSLYIKHSSFTKKNLVRNIWIDSCVITAFATFFETQTKYDGARFYSGSNSNNKSTLMLVPTIPGKNHDDVLVSIPVNPTDCNREFTNFNLGFAMANKKDKFHRDFRENGHLDSLSISVWMGRCVFIILKDLLRQNPSTLDGVNVYFAAYDSLKRNQRPSQKYQYQSTIILVPTRSNGKKHTDDWHILKSSSLYQKWKILSGRDGGLNHGELCPEDCP